MIKYSIVIPFYNEEKNIYYVIKSLKKISNKIKDIEFILVNNGSTDNSQNIFYNVLKKENKKKFKYFKIKKNIGYGHGIKYGLDKASGNYLAWTHADMQTNPTDILKAIKIIKNSKKYSNRLFGFKNNHKLT